MMCLHVLHKQQQAESKMGSACLASVLESLVIKLLENCGATADEAITTFQRCVASVDSISDPGQLFSAAGKIDLNLTFAPANASESIIRLFHEAPIPLFLHGNGGDGDPPSKSWARKDCERVFEGALDDYLAKKEALKRAVSLMETLVSVDAVVINDPLATAKCR